MRRFHVLTLLIVFALLPAAAAQPPGPADGSTLEGLVHEAAPADPVGLAGARVEVVGGAPAGTVFTTDRDGRFRAPRAGLAGAALQVTLAGYEPERVEVPQPGSGALRVALTPEPREVALARSGANACADLPAPPAGVPGLREFARLAVHHDGQLVVRSAQLPFFGNQGYVYRRTDAGWEPNEIDYILLRAPVPLLGGHVYAIAFGGGQETCGAWSIDLTHPR